MSEDEDLLMRADSLCSLILYREGAVLSEQTRRDLGKLVSDLRPRTDAIARGGKSGGSR